MSSFYSYRSHRIALVLILLFALLCTQLPLFNYLGFEFSALLSLVGSLIVGLLTLSWWNKKREEFEGYVWKFIASLIAPIGVLLVLPFLILSLNAFFVKNCSFVQGILLYILLPVPAFLFASSLALLIATSRKKWRKTRFVLIWCVILLHIVIVTTLGPQIFAFNPIVGYFPGFTYDETLEIIDRLLIYRGGTLLASMALLLFAAARQRERQNGRHNRALKFFRHREALAGMILVLPIALLYFSSSSLGFSSSVDRIREALGGTVETEHFTIHYPDTMVRDRELDHLVQTHEFYFDHIARFYRVNPQKKIEVFLYASTDQKGRLVGAKGTNFAKPWLAQVHLNLADVDRSLKHELVHVMAAEFGVPFLRIGMNAGLIEGAAVAVEQVEYDEHIHRLAAMVLAVGTEPDMESLFSFSGFMRVHPSVSYVLAGSFSRFLIERFGIRRFKLLYQTGDFETLYNRPLHVLLAQWRRMVERYELNDADLAKAAYLFKRPSIFAKECARVLANLNSEVREQLRRREFDIALAGASKALELSNNIDATHLKAQALVRLGRFDEAIEFMENRLRDSSVAHSLLPLKLLLGDAYLAIDSVFQAQRLYQDISLTRLSSSYDEASTLRLELLFGRLRQSELCQVFVGNLADSARQALIEQVVKRHPDEALPKYLLAREEAVTQPERATALLESIRRMRVDQLEFHRQRRLARLNFRLGQYERAKIHAWQSLNLVTGTAQVLEIEEMLRLCDWMRERQEASEQLQD